MKFNNEDLLRLLENFGKLFRFDYRIELFNMFELALGNALFSILSGGRADRLRISPHQSKFLQRMFADADVREIDRKIHEAKGRLAQDLRLDEPATDYIDSCVEKLASRIVNAVQRNHLHTVIAVDEQEEPKPEIVSFYTGSKMSDVRFRRLLDDIVRCETLEEKIGTIHANFRSLHDYLDLLESGCLFEEEFDALYAAFSDAELAVLSKVVFYRELRGGDVDFFVVVSEKKDAETEWQTRFVAFMNGLSVLRITEIGKLVDRIDYEVMKLH